MNSGRKISFKKNPEPAQPVKPGTDLILAYGFTRAGNCNCGGTRNELYKKDSYILYYRKTRHVFKIKERNELVVPITSITNLETELKKLFPSVEPVQKKV